MTDPHAMLIAMAKAMWELSAEPENGDVWDPVRAMPYLEPYARAALTALAEPTPDMIEAGVEYWHTHDDFLDDEVTGIFTAMIKSVLGER